MNLGNIITVAGVAIVLVIVVAGFFLFMSPSMRPKGTSTTISYTKNPTTTSTITASGNTTTIAQNHTNINGSYTNSSSASSIQNIPVNLPACGTSDPPFSISPIQAQNITYIEPLGHVNPSGGGHVFPINHVYFYLTLYSNRTAIVTTLVSPGNVTIYKIESFTYYSGSDHKTPIRNDYTLSFAPCGNATGFFYHISSLSNKFLSNFTQPFAYCNNVTTGAEYFQSCGKYVNIKAGAGEVLGTVGGQPGGSQALDWVMEDFRITPLDYANDSRFSSSTGQDYSRYIVCPLDYFSMSVHNTLYGLLGGYPVNGNFTEIVKRTTPPLCGTTAQDIPGTVQGNWFAENISSETFNEGPNLALIHDDINTSVGVFSIGTSMSASGLQAGAYYFTPSNSGPVNRDFSNVTSDGKVYCYQTKEKIYSNGVLPPTETIILQLTTPSRLKIERLSTDNCGSGPWSFTSKHTDFIR
ncbi:MAG: hypothetical protein KGI00_02425 [Candidatus Micrarchaeota archaeon]|nr:hypothetical protein [Candidatus Micrarchaeota archaeon]